MLLNSLLADVKWYPILFDSPMNITRAVCFWLTIALVLAFVVCSFVLESGQRAKFFKASLVLFVVYACAVGIVLLAFTFAEDGIKTALFAPLLILLALVGISAVLLYFKRNKTTLIITGCLCGAAAIATLVSIGVFYGANVDGDGYYNSDSASVNQIVLYLSAIVLIALIIAAAFLFGKKDTIRFGTTYSERTKSISYAAVCIAMSFALSYLRILKLPQGGSVTIASLLPLMIYSYMFGIKKGVFAGLIYGVLQALQDPYIIHPAQFLLDYPIAFSAIGLAGLFAKCDKLNKYPQLQFALGAIVASVLRFVSHVLSGVFAFSAYAVDAGMNAWVYSLAYNSFVFADIAIAIVVGVIVFSSPSFVKQARKFHASKQKEQEGQTAET